MTPLRFGEVVAAHVAAYVAERAGQIEDVLAECITLADFDAIDRITVVEYLDLAKTHDRRWRWGVASMLEPAW